MLYRLRTLLIVLAVGPLVLAGAWFANRARSEYLADQQQRALSKLRPSENVMLSLPSRTGVPPFRLKIDIANDPQMVAPMP